MTTTISDRLSSQESLFNTPESLSILDIKTLVAGCISKSILVVAPHPDDETLGCGGAIALLRQLDLDVKVLVVSDGTQSHPNSLAYPPVALKQLRQRESLTALNILGVAPEAVTFLNLPDGAVPTMELVGDEIAETEEANGAETLSSAKQTIKSKLSSKIDGEINTKRQKYRDVIAFIGQYLNDLTPSTIFLPWRKDPHPDHRASWQLFTTACKQLTYCPRLIEYPIWDWDKEQRQDFPVSINAWRLDISKVLELKRQAIAQYHSQISDLIKDDPEGFRLTPEMISNFTQPWEIYLELKL